MYNINAVHNKSSSGARAVNLAICYKKIGKQWGQYTILIIKHEFGISNVLTGKISKIPSLENNEAEWAL